MNRLQTLLLLLVAIPGFAIATGPERDLSSLRIVLEAPQGGITVLTGTGEPIRAWLPTDSQRFRDPDLHPGVNTVLALRCSAPASECVLLELALDGDGENDLATALECEAWSSPVYSPGGDRIALVCGQAILILSRQGRVQQSIPFHGDLEEDCLKPAYADAYLRWSPDGTLYLVGPSGWANVRLALDGDENPSEESLSECEDGWARRLGRVDLQNGKFEWLNLYHALGGYAEVLDGVLRPTELPDEPAVRALLGSPENPIERPVFSLDRKYYFYVVYKQGWLWKTHAVRYDVIQQKEESIRTFARGLYYK